jgi:1,4-dihydroxy-2-naphthoate octaprenyltransferase
MMMYIKAARPQTLIASVFPILCAFMLAKATQESINMTLLTLCFLIGIFIQIAVNIFNDLIDGENGVDVNRLGDERMSSKANKKTLWVLGLASLLICLLASIPLFEKNLIYIPLGLSSLFFAYGYTGGPYPLAYNGLGEIFVYLYFGIVAFVGTFFAISDNVTQLSVLSASLFGMLSILIIYANNYRDLSEDKKFNKRTIAVKFEYRSTLIFISFILLTSIHKALFTYLTVKPFFLLSLLADCLLFLLILKKINRQKIFKLSLLNLVTTSIIYIAVI